MVVKYEVYGLAIYDGPFPDGVEYIVEESGTEQAVFKSDSLRTCNRVAKQLNRGSGFNGWTPSFILQEMPRNRASI
jgi:hypothetical protein